MAELRALVQAEMARAGEPSYSFVDLSRRRRRKERNRRIGSVVLAFALTAAAIGTAVRIFGSDARPASGRRITPSNVSTLRLEWSAWLDSPVPSDLGNGDAYPDPPTIAGETVYTGTSNGTLYAFSTACDAGGATCKPTWTARLKGAVAHSPTVADGLVFADTDVGKLYAFPTDCHATCSPVWVGGVGHQIYSSPVVARGMVYGIDVWNGTLYAFHETCGTSVCHPAWTASLGSHLSTDLDCGALGTCIVVAPTVADGEVFASSDASSGPVLQAFDARTGAPQWTSAVSQTSPQRFRWPVVDGGRVFVGSTPHLYAFPTRCGAGGGACQPLWVARFPGKAPGVGQPVVAEGSVFVDSNGRTYAFREDCASPGRCPSTWSADASPSLNHLVVGDGLIVAAAGMEGSVKAIEAQCGEVAVCQPTWTARVPLPSSPEVSGGVLYVGTASDRVFAFAAACRTSTCHPSWSWTGDGAVSTPAVSTGAIYVTVGVGRLLAFAPGDRASDVTTAPVASATSKRWTAVAYAAVALFVVGIVFARRRRRTG